eukprot:c23520_g1_i1 orf=144-2543(+)
MDNCVWESNTSRREHDQHNYGFCHRECEYQAGGSNNYISSHITGNYGSSKKSRQDGEDFWHGRNGFGNGLWRMVTGESSQMLSPSGNQRLGRQNCTHWMQSQRAILHGSSCSVHKTGVGSDRINMYHMGDLGTIFKHGFTGLSNTVDLAPRSAGLDFFHSVPTSHASSSASSFLIGCSTTGDLCAGILPITGAHFMKDKIDSWTGSTRLHSSGINVWGTSSVACHADGPSLKEKYIGEMAANSFGYGMGSNIIMGFQNIEMQGPHRNIMHAVSPYAGPSLDYNCVNSSGNCDLVASSVTHSSLLPLSSEGRMASSINRLLNSSGGNSQIRGSCKRKRSAAGSAGSSPFTVPPSYGRRAIKFPRSICAARPSRFDAGSPLTDLFHGATVSSSIHACYYPGNVLDGSGTESMLEFLNRNTWNKIPMIGAHGLSQRNVNSRMYNAQPGQSSSQFHPSFAQHMRRSLVTSQAHTWFSRQAKRQMETGASGTGGSAIMHEGDCSLSSVFSRRNGNSFDGSGWGAGNLFSRDSDYFGVFGTSEEMASGLFEDRQIRNMQIGAPCGPVATAAGSMLSVFDSARRVSSALVNRAGNFNQSFSHLSEVGTIPLLYSSSASLRLAPPISAYFSTRHSTETSQGHLVSPFTSSGSSNNVISGSLPASMHQSLFPAPMQCPYFVDDRGEGILVAPVQNFLRLPIRGVSISPTEAESPHQIVPEDMVVLDPSLAFGGIDLHDQHSDMRLDVDSMSYEELLALEERIGNVNTGLTDEAIAKCLRTSKYSSLDVTVATVSQESEVKCSICQEEY